MSTSYFTYVGPYYECQPEIIPRIIKQIYCTKCKSEQRSAFCPDCGLQTIIRDIEKGYTTKQEQYKYLNNDSLFAPQIAMDNDDKTHYFMLNRHIEGARDMNLDVDYSGVIQKISPEQITKEISNYMGYKEFDYLKKIYGENKVSVQWGVITHYN